jgi:cyclopropane fatty-acyl-phospholipid synthase-like methyltransferase
LEILRSRFAKSSQVLEIGSGTGQHAVYFAAHLKHLTWQPTERLNYLPNLVQRIQAEGGTNIRPPTVLDVTQSVWPVTRVDAMFTANTLHIMSWGEVAALFRGIGTTLAPGGLLCIYGPFVYQDRPTAPSNIAFDRMLQERDPLSGLRHIEAVIAAAAEVGLTLAGDYDQPANNRILVFLKEPATP